MIDLTLEGLEAAASVSGARLLDGTTPQYTAEGCPLVSTIGNLQTLESAVRFVAVSSSLVGTGPFEDLSLLASTTWVKLCEISANPCSAEQVREMALSLCRSRTEVLISIFGGG